MADAADGSAPHAGDEFAGLGAERGGVQIRVPEHRGDAECVAQALGLGPVGR